MAEETTEETRGKYGLREYKFGQKGDVVKNTDSLEEAKAFKAAGASGLSERGVFYEIEQEGKPLGEQQSEMTFDYSEGAESGQEGA